MFVRFGVADVRSVPGFVPCGFDCAASTMRPVGHRRSGCAFDAVSLPFALSVSPAVPHGPDLVSCLVWSACPSWLDRLVSRLFRVALVLGSGLVGFGCRFGFAPFFDGCLCYAFWSASPVARLAGFPAGRLAGWPAAGGRAARCGRCRGGGGGVVRGSG